MPHLAYQEIDAGIQSVREHFDRLCTPNNVANNQSINELYRIRLVEKFEHKLKRSDLFHIPFNLRHKVTRQRYSLPGLPCLYLGGTLYISWEELGRPSFDSIYFARFKPNDDASITFLDFGYRPALIAAMIEAKQNECNSPSPTADFAVAQAICWPLIAASSIKRHFANEPFIAEYIVPQLILQWIINSKEHDGIRYFSVRVDHYMDNPAMACNYVFPAKTFGSSGHCTVLRDKFELSEPFSWQLFERINTVPLLSHHGQSKLSLINDHETTYADTPFGRMEAKSLRYPCASIKEE